MSARECVIPVFVPHLGCPHQCVFCDQRRISGSAESASAEKVRQAISSAAALPRSGAKRQLAFYGGSFTAVPAALQEELLAVAAEAIARGELDAIRLSTRPDAIDDEVLARLRRFGVETVELGAQSMDDEVLRLSGRGHTAADVERAAAAIKAAGFRLILQMMTGLVGDSDEKDLATARRLIALRPEGVRIYPTVIVRGTPLWELWKRGEYREHTVEDAVRVCAKLLPLFEEAGIPVIRLGLNPSEELSGGEAAGGAYHSALGELVKSRVMLEKARALLKDVPPGSRVRLGAAERSLSQAIGQKKENLLRLQEECGLEDVKVVPAALKEREIVLLSVENGEETRYNNTVIS